jgi:hypothetical protein
MHFNLKQTEFIVQFFSSLLRFDVYLVKIDYYRQCHDMKQASFCCDNQMWKIKRNKYERQRHTDEEGKSDQRISRKVSDAK